jgi:Transposase, Mutator family
LADLQSRGLRTDRSLLIILDGAKARHKAVTQTFGSAALIHRCHVHKLRNILEHLPEGQRPWVRAIVARAYKQAEIATARRLLQGLARRLEDRYPSAAASVREGLEETLTGWPGAIARTPPGDRGIQRRDQRGRGGWADRLSLSRPPDPAESRRCGASARWGAGRGAGKAGLSLGALMPVRAHTS